MPNNKTISLKNCDNLLSQIFLYLVVILKVKHINPKTGINLVKFLHPI